MRRSMRTLAVVTLGGALALTPATVSFAATAEASVTVTAGSELVRAGERLNVGDSRQSPNGRYRLVMQPDGNLVLYAKGSSKGLWSSRTTGAKKGAFATMQTDGNFVVYSATGKAVFYTATSKPGSFLSVQDDGNLVVYSKSFDALWDRYSGLDNLLRPGEMLRPGQLRRSTDRRYRLEMQRDGNLVLYKSSKALWSTKTTGAKKGAFALMQDDGNFVVYNAANKPVWHSRTATPGSFLAVQNDGNVVIYTKSFKALWSTKTTGK